MSMDIKNAAEKHLKIKWFLVCVFIANACLIPINIIRQIPVIGTYVGGILSLICSIFAIYVAVSCYKNEKNGGEPNKLQRMIDDGLVTASLLQKHPIQTIKARIAELKEADSSEKVKKILSLIVGIVIIVFTIFTAVYLVILFFLVCFLLGGLGFSGGSDSLLEAFRTAHGGRDPYTSDELHMWASEEGLE